MAEVARPLPLTPDSLIECAPKIKKLYSIADVNHKVSVATMKRERALPSNVDPDSFIEVSIPLTQAKIVALF